MRAYINDSLRGAISWIILYLGLLACGWQRFQLLAFGVNQRRLKRKYGITDDTPVLTYGPEVAQSIRAKADKDAKFATTSGTTGKPKELLYTKRRLFALKLCQINCEYRSKRASGRLGAVQVRIIEFKDFVSMNSNWETQFKFLPLIQPQRR